MPRKKKKHKKPPCPDPDLYQWVETKEGGHWRRRRRKNAPLNRSFSTNVSATKVVSPAAKRIREKLEEYTLGLNTGRFQGRLTGLLGRLYKDKAVIDLSALAGFEFQMDHPLEEILTVPFKVIKDSSSITLQIPIVNGVVKRHNSLVTDFYFEGILLYGDASPHGVLEVKYAVSKPYSFTDTVTGDCKLILPVPENGESWMLLLKVSCLEGNEMAVHARHYGMKVVEAGSSL